MDSVDNAEGIITREKIMEEVFLDLDGNSSVLLDDPDTAWIVQSGRVNVFAVQVIEDRPLGRRIPVFEADEGQVLFGVRSDRGFGMLVSGVDGTTIMKRHLPGMIKALAGKDNPALLEPLIYFVESWVIGLSTGISRKALPTHFFSLQTGGEQRADQGRPLRSGEDVLWVKPLDGALCWMGSPELAIGQGDVFPITKKTWLTGLADTRVQSFHTRDLVREPMDCSLLFSCLDKFNELAVDSILLQKERSATAELSRLQEKSRRDRALLSRAFALSVAEKGGEQEEGGGEKADPLLAACRQVARYLRVDIDPKSAGGSSASAPQQRLLDVARKSRLKVRQVLLKDDWWRQDSGPLLAFGESDGRPLALLPVSPGAYRIYDPSEGTDLPVKEAMAEKIAPRAYIFYRPFPDKVLTSLELLRLGLQDCWRKDMATVLLVALFSGLLGMMFPLAVGYLVDTVIPEARSSQLLQLVTLLLVGGLADFGFQITRSVAWLRVEGKLDGTVQAAVWDRLLELPVTFFRRYSVGDLAVRANGIAIIRQVLSGIVMNTVFAGFISIFNFILLFLYSPALGLVATGLMVIFLAITGVLALQMMRQQRRLAETEGKISGLVLQLIFGISKLRVAGAENHAFLEWAKVYHQQRVATTEARTLGNHLQVLNAGYPVLVSLIIFYAAYSLSGQLLSSGAFLTFYAALTTFMAAMMALTGTLFVILQIVPLYERVKPILQERPEVDEGKDHPGELTGRIEVSHINFRYRADGPLVLQDVSLQVNPGEFIAIVGSSGSGKSTLFRLLLGFEQPEAGAVFYDGQELSGLDVRFVRSQQGVVLQNGQLMTGDILTNIVGATDATLDDAWEAARMAGLESDIKGLPMGMHTFINEGGSTFSGGQRQRLLIARAIVKKPRIVLFDEATSALDNLTQSMVSQSLEKMQTTRVVIAHRISTIVNADRIYVMEKGKVIQVGTFEELLKQSGPFAEMAKRQMA